MLLIMGVLVALIVGAALMWVASTGIIDEWFATPKRITWLEFGIGAAVCCFIVVPFTIAAGNKWALSNNLRYHEFWSGYETAALRGDTECHRDGSCQFTYDCDPYIVTIHHPATYDSKGNQTSAAYDTDETHYHSCPEATVEWDFTINTTLGSYHIERTFADDPQPYRDSHGLRGGVRHGAPPFWQDALNHLNVGDPRPVTVKKDYKNYILASQSTILHKFSADVAAYKASLPKPASTQPVHDFYLADKAYFVGTPAQPGWNEAVMRFNAAFGSDLQGDLHVVVVGSGVAVAPDAYAGALNAYWTGPELDRDDISKNALVVVIGTDGSTVQWARAFTGMPRGNEALLLDIQRELKGKRLDPTLLIGNPVGKLDNGKFAGVTRGQGVLEQQVWGTNQFKRVCMECGQQGSGGFTYLGSEIQPTTGQKWAILSLATFLSVLVWVAFVLLGIPNNPFAKKAET